MNFFRVASLFLVGSMLCSNAVAIVVRHDVPDSDYLAAEADYPALFTLYRTPLGHGDRIATVIADRWALTAAHCAREKALLDAVQSGAEGYAVEIAGQEALIDRIVPHGAGEQQSADIALLRFKHAVDHVQPIALYSGSDEDGRVITMPGWGGTGNGKTGLAPEDGAFRVACNRIDRAENGRLFWIFDDPDSGALPLEGISGPGDSGGPALLPVANGWVLAGISSGQDTKGGAEGLYGVEEVFVRVSDFVDWTEGVIGNDSLTSDAQPTGRECGIPGKTYEKTRTPTIQRAESELQEP